MKKYFVLIIILYYQFSYAQFAPQVGFGANDAVFKDDAKIKSWATNCSLEKGWVDISNKSLGKTEFGTTQSAIGKAGDGDIVSLGDSGVAILTFEKPIRNGVGADFAVFENGFLYQNAGLAFLELAFVDVSSDGVNYYRFPSISNTQINSQIGGFEYLDATKIHNLAGKYISKYGTPFDLEELKTIVGLNIGNITHVKITDVVGSILPSFGQYDSKNNIINEPFATPFSTSGFDLDAVGVINQVEETDIKYFDSNTITKIYPTILKIGQKIYTELSETNNIKSTNIFGQITDLEVVNKEIDSSKLPSGMHFLHFIINKETFVQKIIIE